MTENDRKKTARLIQAFAKTHVLPDGWASWLDEWVRWGYQKAVTMHPLHDLSRHLLLAHDNNYDIIVIHSGGHEYYVTAKGIKQNR